MNTLTRKETADRSKIHVANAKEMKCWAHKLVISMDELRIIVEKVDNSGKSSRWRPAMTHPRDDQIRIRARQLWEQAEMPAGRDDECWHRAERELKEMDEVVAKEDPPSVLPG